MGHAAFHHGVNLFLLLGRQNAFGREHRLHVLPHHLSLQVGNLLHFLHRRVPVRFVGAKDFVQFHSPDLKVGPRPNAGLSRIRGDLVKFFRLFVGQSQLSLHPFVVKETEHGAAESLAVPAAARSPLFRPLGRGPNRQYEQPTQDQSTSPYISIHAILLPKFFLRIWFDDAADGKVTG
jgi:hypothetical protein